MIFIENDRRHCKTSFIRMQALLLGGTYQRKAKPGAATCHICQEKRSNLSGHLLRMHMISKNSPEIKGFGTKVDATKVVADGKYSKVDEVIKKYCDEHFDNLAEGRQAVKEGSQKSSKRRKMKTVRKIIYWMVDHTKALDIQSVMERIADLGKADVGYFHQYRTGSNDKGRPLLQA